MMSISKKGINKVALVVAIVLFITNILTALTTLIIVSLTRYPTPPTKEFEIEYYPNEDLMAAIYAKYASNVVEIYAQNSAGSGIIMESNDGKPLIITNYHVIANNGSITSENSIAIRLNGALSNSGYGEITVLGYDVYNDIAVLRFGREIKGILDVYNELEGSDKKHIEAASAYTTGQRVLALGNALGKGISACEGILSLVDTSITINNKTVPVLQITAPLNSGNSGGPLFNLAGRLIGINCYQSRSVSVNGSSEFVDNLSYSIPIDIAMAIYNQAKQNPKNHLNINSRQLSIYNAKLDSNRLVDYSMGWDFKQSYKITLNSVQEIQSIEVGTSIEQYETTFSEHSQLAVGDTLIKVGNYSLYSQNEICNISFARIMGELYNYSREGNGEPLRLVVKRGLFEREIVIDSFKRV